MSETPPAAASSISALNSLIKKRTNTWSRRETMLRRGSVSVALAPTHMVRQALLSDVGGITVVVADDDVHDEEEEEDDVLVSALEGGGRGTERYRVSACLKSTKSDVNFLSH